jgi:hypothetical protein
VEWRINLSMISPKKHMDMREKACLVDEICPSMCTISTNNIHLQNKELDEKF